MCRVVLYFIALYCMYMTETHTVAYRTRTCSIQVTPSPVCAQLCSVTVHLAALPRERDPAHMSHNPHPLLELDRQQPTAVLVILQQPLHLIHCLKELCINHSLPPTHTHSDTHTHARSSHKIVIRGLCAFRKRQRRPQRTEPNSTGLRSWCGMHACMRRRNAEAACGGSMRLTITHVRASSVPTSGASL